MEEQVKEPYVRREIFTTEWNGYFVKEAKYVGYVKSMWGRNGRELLALGRTPEEAIELSHNKLSKDGYWRLSQYIISHR